MQFAKSNQPATAAASAQAAPVASPAAPGPAVKKEYDEARLQVGLLGTAGGGVVVGLKMTITMTTSGSDHEKLNRQDLHYAYIHVHA